MITGLVFFAPFELKANCNKAPGGRISFNQEIMLISFNLLTDTIPVSKQGDLPSKDKPLVENATDKVASTNPDGEIKENAIKAVPKSRRQSKPKIVNTNIEVKPIRVIKPKIIRKIVPLG